MKRKLGVALLIVATALAGTPEAVKQFHDLNRSLRAWASTSLGGSFLVYAEGTNERALPDRYDYHEVTPVMPRATAPDASSYGLMADLTLPATVEHTCPFARQREAVQIEVARRAPAVEQHVAVQTARRPRPLPIKVRQDQLAREIERATGVAARMLGTKLNAQQFAELLRTQALEAKLKGLRIKTSAETTKAKRVAPVRIARLEKDEALPVADSFEFSAPLPPEIAWTRRGGEEENRPAAAEEPAKRNANGRARPAARTRPGARAPEPREFDVAPFVIMASTDGEAKGFNCNGKDN